VVPDATTRALELRKGSADAAINSLPADTVETLARQPRLEVLRAPGTSYQYLAMNLRDPVLRDVRVRRALAYAIDREPMIRYLWRGMARPANSVLPPQHWAYDAEAANYPYDPEKARRLLDEAGYPPGADGIRFHLAMKSSTNEGTRLFCAVLQQQLRQVGIALDLRTYEFATFYADVLKGNVQMYTLQWVGVTDPDMLRRVYHSSQVPPVGFNRIYYKNPEVDRLIADARGSTDRSRRAADYRSIQQILNRDLPYIHLWWMDNVLIHSRRLVDVQLSSAGDYGFLRTASLRE